jgi:hypothetical protein
MHKTKLIIMKSIVILAMTLAAPYMPAMAQEPATVTGRITNENGDAIPTVLIRIESLNVGIMSAVDGSYRLVAPGQRIRPGQKIQITASMTGYAIQSHTLTLFPGSNLTQNFQLKPGDVKLEEIVVTGSSITDNKSVSKFEGTTWVSIKGDSLTFNTDSGFTAKIYSKKTKAFTSLRGSFYSAGESKVLLQYQNGQLAGEGKLSGNKIKFKFYDLNKKTMGRYELKRNPDL